MKKNRFPYYIALCTAGIIINYAGALLAARLNLPVYLDTIGTIGVSVIGGLLPGITVGFVTNLINSFTDSTNLFFAFVNVMLAVVASFFARKGSFKKPKMIPVIIIVLSACAAACGSALIWSMNGGEIGEGIFPRISVWNSRSLTKRTPPSCWGLTGIRSSPTPIRNSEPNTRTGIKNLISILP